MDSLKQLVRAAAEVRGRHPFLAPLGAGLESHALDNDTAFTVAVVGRMKAGKSTLINALVGHPLVVSDVNEATATINRIVWAPPEEAGDILVSWKSGSCERLPLTAIEQWTGKGDGVKELAARTASIQFHVNLEKLRKVNIVDTPGLGSTEDFHEAAIREFLEDINKREQGKSDAILYVIPPVARESDADVLADFDKGRLPGMGPYNTVCVLHKWDAQEGDPFLLAEAMAQRAKSQLVGKVADVIPVSGPLALTARCASDDWLSRMTDMIHRFDHPGLERSLIADATWNRDPFRKQLRQDFLLIPWASFKLVARLLLKHTTPSSSVADTRAMLLEKSGIARLEDFLQRRFFEKSALIRHLSQAGKINAVVETFVLALHNRLMESEESDRVCPEIQSKLRVDSPAWNWVAKHYAAERNEQPGLRRDLATLSDLRDVVIEGLKERHLDFDAMDWLESHPDSLPQGDCKTLLTGLSDGAGPGSFCKADKDRLIRQIHLLGTNAMKKDQRILEHLTRRLLHPV